MRWDLGLIAAWIIGNTVYTEAVKPENSCELPKGLYRNSCINYTVEFCPNLRISGNPCKFSADCDPDGMAPYNYSVHNEFTLPQQTLLVKATASQGYLAHPYVDLLKQQNRIGPVECNPCIMPTGNYTDSCTNFLIVYSNLPAPGACQFEADCDIRMVKHSTKGKNYRPLNRHNLVSFPSNIRFENVSNLEGNLQHDSEKFEVTTAACASEASDASSKLPIVIVGAAIALTI